MTNLCNFEDFLVEQQAPSNWTCIRSGYYTAKRDHKKPCGACNGMIKSGQKYHIWVGLEDGKFVEYKGHSLCYDGFGGY